MLIKQGVSVSRSFISGWICRVLTNSIVSCAVLKGKLGFASSSTYMCLSVVADLKAHEGNPLTGKGEWQRWTHTDRSKLQWGLYPAFRLVPQKDLQTVKDRQFNAARYQEQKQSVRSSLGVQKLFVKRCTLLESRDGGGRVPSVFLPTHLDCVERKKEFLKCTLEKGQGSLIGDNAVYVGDCKSRFLHSLFLICCIITCTSLNLSSPLSVLLKDKPSTNECLRRAIKIKLPFPPAKDSRLLHLLLQNAKVAVTKERSIG